MFGEGRNRSRRGALERPQGAEHLQLFLHLPFVSLVPLPRLARIYNDQSVMENHHCAMTFAILSRRECNVLAGLAPEVQRAVRKTIISSVLCTDMANHFSLTQVGAGGGECRADGLAAGLVAAVCCPGLCRHVGSVG